MKHLKLGPDAPHRTGKMCYIALHNAQGRTQTSGELMISKECHSLDEVKAEIGQLRAHLDEILRQAKKSSGRNSN